MSRRSLPIRFPRLSEVWVLLTVAAAFIGPASSPVGLEVWWTLTSGKWMAEHHALLGSDPFTSAPAAAGPFLNTQWLAQLVYYVLERLGGLELVILGTALAVAAAYWLVLAACVVASGHTRLACVSVWIGYVLGFSNLTARPQTLAYPVFGLFLLAIMRAEWRKDTRWLWLLPPAMMVWANLPGSFVAGLALLGCCAVGRAASTRRLRPAYPYVFTELACCLAALATPYGSGSLAYVASIGSNLVIRDLVTEWAPTTATRGEGIVFFLSVASLGVLALRSRARLTASEALILVVFGCLALSSVRSVVWWGMAVAPTTARLLGGLSLGRLRQARERGWLNLILTAAVVLVAALSLPWTKNALPILPPDKRALVSDDTPISAGRFLQSNDPPLPGRMLNHQLWGGYLNWVAWPRHQAFVDGRIEIHPAQVWLDYLDITFPTANWRALLDKYNITCAVLSRAEENDLIETLRQADGWHVAYEDGVAVVLERG
ncbi:MAG: hypothetical protein ACR2IK_09135 [Chloroflexota bacterium]